MKLFKPDESQLRNAGSLKWTGMPSAEGKPTMGAWVAEMDFGTSPAIQARLQQALEEGLTGYVPKWADDGVCQALTRFQESRFGWVIKESDVRVVGSVLSALEATITKLVRPDAPVAVLTPAYMPFLTIPPKLGRKAIEVPCLHQPRIAAPHSGNADHAWSIDLDALKAALEAGAGLVILCNPWNPTGRVLSVSELRAVHDVVCQYDALVFADEIHSPLVYGDHAKFTSYASLGPSFAAHTVTAVAASKGWNVAGFPAAQVIITDEQLQENWDNKASAFAGRPTAFGLLAATSAYLEPSNKEWLDLALATISSNLDLLDEALKETQIDYTRPQGTYLTWWGWERYQLDASPHTVLLEQASLATNSGSSLGSLYDQWTRVNAAMSPALWRESVEKAVAVINGLPLR